MQRIFFGVFLCLSSVCFSASPDEKEFIPLFNGKDLSGWRHHGPVKKNNSWEVQNGVLTNNLRADRSGSSLVTERTFRDFIVRFEFMVPEGSNSGIYLRGRHEIQLTGDYSARKLGPAGNGAIWNVKAADVYASKPSGEWQSMEASMFGSNVTVLLNGTKIHDNVRCDKPTGGALDSNVNEPGPIMIQGTLGSIKFRNIRIKELPR
jgi:hypothetical protein